MQDSRHDPQFKNIFSFYDMVEAYNDSESRNLFLLVHNNLWFKSMVIKNFYELTHWTKKHNHPHSDKMMWKNADSGLRQRIQQNIIRHIFNYLSSLFGFIEFHRSHNEEFLRTNDEIYKQSQALKKNNHESHKFLQDLRNYIVHYKPIPFGSEIKYKIEWDIPRRRFYIIKEDLLQWKNWSNDAKSYILSQENKIPLFDILNDHFKLFIRSQFDHFKLLFITNSTLTSELKDRLNEIYKQANIIGATGSLSFNDVFLRYFSSVCNKKNPANFNDI